MYLVLNISVISPETSIWGRLYVSPSFLVCFYNPISTESSNLSSKNHVFLPTQPNRKKVSILKLDWLLLLCGQSCSLQKESLSISEPGHSPALPLPRRSNDLLLEAGL